MWGIKRKLVIKAYIWRPIWIYLGPFGGLGGQKCHGGQHLSIFGPYMVRNAVMAHDIKKEKKRLITQLEKINNFVS